MKKLLFIMISVSVLCSAANAKEYSFDQALQRALSVDEQVLASAKDVERARSERYAAMGLYFPKAGVKGQYTRIDSPIEIDLNPIRDTISALHGGIPLPDFITLVQEEKFFKGSVYASMPLFTGGKISAANLAAVSSLSEATAKYNAAKNNVLVDTASKYYKAMLASEIVEVRKDFLANAQELADNSSKMYKSGMISKVEKMSTDITLYQAQRDYGISLNDAELANTVLQNFLSEDAEITFSSNLFILKDSDIKTLNEYKEAALEGSDILKIVDSKKGLADAALRAQASSFLPTIYVFGSREIYDKDLTILDPQYAYGVGFEWSIFDGFSGTNKTKAAKRQRESVDFIYEKHLKDINSAIEYYHKTILNSIFKYNSVQEEIIFAKEVLAARQLGFRAGTSTSLEVNVSRTQLLKSELDSLNASYECVSSLAGLLNIIGESSSFDFYRQKAVEVKFKK